MPHGPGVTGICTGGGLKVTITPVVVGMGDFSGGPIAPFAGGATRPASRLAGPHLKTTRGYSGPAPELLGLVDTARRRCAIQ